MAIPVLPENQSRHRVHIRAAISFRYRPGKVNTGKALTRNKNESQAWSTPQDNKLELDSSARIKGGVAAQDRKLPAGMGSAALEANRDWEDGEVRLKKINAGMKQMAAARLEDHERRAEDDFSLPPIASESLDEHIPFQSSVDLPSHAKKGKKKGGKKRLSAKSDEERQSDRDSARAKNIADGKKLLDHDRLDQATDHVASPYPFCSRRSWGLQRLQPRVLIAPALSQFSRHR